jgi:predicted transcriptional regulator
MVAKNFDTVTRDKFANKYTEFGNKFETLITEIGTPSSFGSKTKIVTEYLDKHVLVGRMPNIAKNIRDIETILDQTEKKEVTNVMNQILPLLSQYAINQEEFNKMKKNVHTNMKNHLKTKIVEYFKSLSIYNNEAIIKNLKNGNITFPDDDEKLFRNNLYLPIGFTAHDWLTSEQILDVLKPVTKGFLYGSKVQVTTKNPLKRLKASLFEDYDTVVAKNIMDSKTRDYASVGDSYLTKKYFGGKTRKNKKKQKRRMTKKHN